MLLLAKPGDEHELDDEEPECLTPLPTSVDLSSLDFDPETILPEDLRRRAFETGQRDGNHVLSVYLWGRYIRRPDVVEAGIVQADDHIWRATSLDAMGRKDLAVREYTLALKIDPKHEVAFNNRGLSYSELSMPELAKRDYDIAISLNPGYTQAFYNRALLFLDEGDYERAVDDCTAALKYNALYADAYNNRAYTYLMMRRYEDALADIDKALSLGGVSDDSSCKLHWRKGFVLCSLGRFPEAGGEFEVAYNKDNSFSKLYRDSTAIEGLGEMMLHFLERLRTTEATVALGRIVSAALRRKTWSEDLNERLVYLSEVEEIVSLQVVLVGSQLLIWKSIVWLD